MKVRRMENVLRPQSDATIMRPNLCLSHNCISEDQPLHLLPVSLLPLDFETSILWPNIWVWSELWRYGVADRSMRQRKLLFFPVLCSRACLSQQKTSALMTLFVSLMVALLPTMVHQSSPHY